MLAASAFTLYYGALTIVSLFRIRFLWLGYSLFTHFSLRLWRTHHKGHVDTTVFTASFWSVLIDAALARAI
jgi:hypothetical protein